MRNRTFASAVPVGSAGKTTLTNYVMAAYAPNPAVLSVESATPAGNEIELFERSDASMILALKARLIAPDSERTLIVDAGVTDSELVAQALMDLSKLRPLAHVTVVMPVMTDKKGATGLERYAPTLPDSVRRVAVLSQVEDYAAHEAFLASDRGKAVSAFCDTHGVELCPVPLLYCPLLDTSSAHHALLNGCGLSDVAELDIDAMVEDMRKKRGNRDIQKRVGLALDGIGMAKAALANTSAVYDFIAGGPEATSG